ncbi:MAG: adenylyl-sulfate kinase [Pseudomonadota bacterium]
MVIWLIGMAGSGKTTIGRQVYAQWKEVDRATVLIDGDVMREIFRHNRGSEPYSVEGRRENAERVASLCRWLDCQGINVVCCILLIFEEVRTWNRDNYSEYFEVFIDTPEKDLVERRQLYREARQGKIKNVVGVDIPFALPKSSDMVIYNGAGAKSPQVLGRKILENAIGVSA